MVQDNHLPPSKQSLINQILALNMKDSLISKLDIEKLNEKFEYLGYKIIIFDEKPTQYDLYGYCVFKDNKEWTEYFNIIGSKNCLFIHHLDNKKTIDYSNTYTIIKTAKPIYIYFEKVN